MGKFAKIVNKTGKIILVVIACYLAYAAYVIVRYGHSTDAETCKQYLWIFKDSIKKDIDPPGSYSICFSNTKKRDVRNIFHYYQNNEMYIVTVWEFKDLANINFNQITVNQNISLNDIKFISGETLDAQSTGPINIKYGFAFHNGMNINLDSQSEITGTFEGANYKGFYGKIHKMSFNNEKGKPQILFEYIDNIYNHLTKSYNPSFSQTVFLLYKGHKSFYVIIINSENPFKDASIIDIFNLQ